MTASIWFYSIPIVAFIVAGVLAVRGGRGQVHCSSCVTPMSARRRPLLLGGWVCPHCGTRMDRGGSSISRSGPVS
jgi:ribosomal protein L37AE/L43A